jgi:RNA polymerase sigma-70 factor (ECF subfamily)
VGLLAREHSAALARFLRYLGVASSDVEDALQDVFIVAHRRLIETPELSDAPGPWLRGVAVNVARNRARSSQRSRVEFVDEAPEMIDARTPESEVAAERDRRRVLRLLSTLNEEHRAALVLFEIEGRPMKEVASTLGCALPTAYKYVTSAQTKLREAFLQESETR